MNREEPKFMIVKAPKATANSGDRMARRPNGTKKELATQVYHDLGLTWLSPSNIIVSNSYGWLVGAGFETPDRRHAWIFREDADDSNYTVLLGLMREWAEKNLRPETSEVSRV